MKEELSIAFDVRRFFSALGLRLLRWLPAEHMPPTSTVYNTAAHIAVHIGIQAGRASYMSLLNTMLFIAVDYDEPLLLSLRSIRPRPHLFYFELFIVLQ